MSFDERIEKQLRKIGAKQDPDGTWRSAGFEPGGIFDSEPEYNPWGTLVSVRKGEKEGPERIGVEITRYACRQLDYDNLVGGCKPLIDQLRYGGIIPDDREKDIKLTVEQFQVAKKKQEGTRVVVRYN